MPKMTTTATTGTLVGGNVIGGTERVKEYDVQRKETDEITSRRQRQDFGRIDWLRRVRNMPVRFLDHSNSS